MSTPETGGKRIASFFWWDGDTLVVNILGKPVVFDRASVHKQLRIKTPATLPGVFRQHALL